jgi:hypothetical protein
MSPGQKNDSPQHFALEDAVGFVREQPFDAISHRAFHR